MIAPPIDVSAEWVSHSDPMSVITSAQTAVIPAVISAATFATATEFSSKTLCFEGEAVCINLAIK